MLQEGSLQDPYNMTSRFATNNNKMVEFLVCFFLNVNWNVQAKFDVTSLDT